MACDICGKNTEELQTLREVYQTSDIKQICGKCACVINSKERSLFSMVLNIKTELLKNFMRVRKEQK